MYSRFHHLWGQLSAWRLSALQWLASRQSQSALVAADASGDKDNTSAATRTADSPSRSGHTGKSEKVFQDHALQDRALQERALQKEILANRNFSLAEAIGREGGSFMKGESAIPRPLRALTQINQFITTHIKEPTGTLSTTLRQWASTDLRVSRQLDTPLVALAQIIENLLSDPTTFCEFFRQVAIAESQLTGDRPYFQPLGQTPHPDAPHTHDNIRQQLGALLQTLKALQQHQQ